MIDSRVPIFPLWVSWADSFPVVQAGEQLEISVVDPVRPIDLGGYA